jgi:hypothetical protein
LQKAAPVAVVPPPEPAPAPPPAAPPPEEKGNGLRVASYAALGVGVVGLGVGTVFALQANGKYSDANDLCPSFPCQLSQDDATKRAELGDQGSSARTVSLVGFIVGGVGVATGVTLFIVSGNKGKQAGMSVAPVLGLGSAGLKGSF